MLGDALAMVLAISVPCGAVTVPEAAQPKLTTLYSFPGGGAGGFVEAGLVLNSTSGVLYGTTADGGLYGWGSVYQLVPGAGGVWTETVLYSFNPINVPGDGASPQAGLVLSSSGVLYGTTTFGGTSDDGTVFELLPKAGGGPWTEKVLYSFTGSAVSPVDGAEPEAGLFLNTTSGVLYGTTYAGGTAGFGTVFQVVPAGGGKWTEKVLYSFTGLADGGNPVAGVTQATSQVLYGTTYTGGALAGSTAGGGFGTVFELVPAAGGVWTETVLYSFGGTVASPTNGTDGSDPESGVTLHYVKTANGTSIVLYGSTFWAGSSTGCPLGGYAAGCGTIFSLTSPTTSGTPWTFAVLYTFTGTGIDGAHPTQDLSFTTSGLLYGTTFSGGSTTDQCFGASYLGCGTIFLLKSTTSGPWTETVLHVFDGDDGGGPNGLVPGASGIYYGSTYVGGTAGGYGSVFQLTPP
jgi:uncharacterized repeat protein (TIGR03803 family)